MIKVLKYVHIARHFHFKIETSRNKVELLESDSRKNKLNLYSKVIHLH
jgi:hypothetical protein